MKQKTLKRTNILLFILLLGSILNVYAQVTIGSNREPASGALLQLKETEDLANSKRGLVLPRVELESIYEAKIGGVTDFSTQKEIHTGLWVYNMFDNTATITDVDKLLCPGPYVWIGDKWLRLMPPCNAIYGGKIVCNNNITDITVGVCQELNRLGSFQLIAFNEAVITIKNGDILGQIDGYKIIAQKSSAGGDTDTYVVTKDNSPMDINVIVTGPSSNTAKTIKIPIDISSKISGAQSVSMDGCPYSTVNITTNYLITDPTTIIFTSGLDGLSRGYQDFKDDNGYFIVSALGLNLPSFVDDNFLVRPWGIKGVPYQGKSGGGTAIGTPGITKKNVNYWPFIVSWQPYNTDVKILNPLSTAPDIYKEPNFTLVYSGTNLPKPTPATPDECGYISYKTSEEQTGTIPVWEEFIKMKPIDQAPIFSEGIETFIINKPYTLSKTVTLEQSSGGTASFDIRQIHYGTRILDINGGSIEGEQGRYLQIPGYNPEKENYEFKFKISSNVKWVCTTLEVSYLDKNGAAITPIGDNMIESSVNLSKTGPMSFGPEEDAYGTPRERIVTLKFSKTPTIPANGIINILITLDDPKLRNQYYSGREYLAIQLINN